jgi:hypothetical protein
MKMYIEQRKTVKKWWHIFVSFLKWSVTYKKINTDDGVWIGISAFLGVSNQGAKGPG